MSTNNDDVLGLAPLAPEPSFGMDTTSLAVVDSNKTMASISAINDESFKQKVVIDAVSSKARYGMRRIMEIDQTACAEFNTTALTVMNMNQSARGSSYEIYSTAFGDRLLKMAARHIYGLIEISATSIAKEVMRSTKPIEPPGFIKRLLGS